MLQVLNILNFEFWILNFVTWNMEFGIWNLVFGASYLGAYFAILPTAQLTNDFAFALKGLASPTAG